MKRMFTLQQTGSQLSLLVVFIGLSFISAAQTWQPWGPNDFDKLSYKNASDPSIALHNGTPYVAFDEEGIRVKKLRSDGSGWDLVGAAGFSGAAGSARDISLLFIGTVPYVAYSHTNTSNRGIVKRYNGTTWETVGSGPFSTAGTGDITMAVSTSNNLYVGYTDGGTMMVKMFDGTDWQAVGGTDLGSGAQMSMALEGNTPYVSYRDGSAGFAATVRKFNGTTWETVGTPGFSLPPVGPGQVQFTSLALDGTTPYVAYVSSHAGDKLCVKKFNGSTWETVGVEGFSAGTAFDITLKIHGGVPYVAYRDNGSGNGQRATVKKFDGSSWITVGTQAFSTAGAYDLSFGFNGTTPYVAYASGFSSSTYNEAVVMRLNSVGNGWERIGTVTDLHNGFFVFNDTIPYASFIDVDHGTKGTVKRFNGTTWQTVGTEGFTPTGITYFTLTFDNNKVPYISYSYNSNTSGTVMKYNGTAWENVGSSITGISPFTLYFDASNAPYIVYRHLSSGINSIGMKRFDGSSWQTIQSASFSTGTITHFNMAVENHAPSYLVYADPSQSSKATVKMYNGSTWVTVGTAGFTTAGIQNPFISLIDGVPHIAFRDGSASWNATVMKFNGNSWEHVGPAGFSSGDESNPQLIKMNGVLYIKYKDGFRMFNGTNWIDVGSLRPTYSFGYILQFHGNIPYVVYSDGPAESKATVKRFTGNSTNWEAVGNAAFTSGQASNFAMARHADTLYLVFTSYKGGVFAKKLVYTSLLPVKLVSYTALKKDAAVKLEWSVTAAHNNKEFIISRSTNGTEFNEMGRIQGENNSLANSYYSYYDRTPLAGENYYKLEQVDVDGRKTMLGIRTVRFSKQSHAYVYPNPAYNRIAVAFEPATYRRLIVSNITGKELRKLSIDPAAAMATISLDGLPAGIYVITLTGIGESQSIQVVKR